MTPHRECFLGATCACGREVEAFFDPRCYRCIIRSVLLEPPVGVGA